MSEHVSQRRMKAFVTGSLGSQERAQVEAHIRTCSGCRNRMLDEGAPPSDEELFPKRLRYITIGALATLFAVGIAAVFWWMRTNMMASPASGGTNVQPDIASIRDGNGALTLTADGRLESTYTIPEAYEKPLKVSLTTQHVPVPKMIADLPKGYPITDTRKPGTFRLLAPIGTAVLSDRPTLTWESLPDASNYTVVITKNGSTVQTSPALLDTDWQTPSLMRGASYEWRVYANRAGARVESTKMRTGEATFFILDENSARELDQLARGKPTEHLLLGVAFAGAGAIERAEEELSTVVRNNPRTYLLKELVANLRPGIDAGR